MPDEQDENNRSSLLLTDARWRGFEPQGLMSSFRTRNRDVSERFAPPIINVKPDIPGKLNSSVESYPLGGFEGR